MKYPFNKEANKMFKLGKYIFIGGLILTIIVEMIVPKISTQDLLYCILLINIGIGLMIGGKNE